MSPTQMDPSAMAGMAAGPLMGVFNKDAAPKDKTFLGTAAALSPAYMAYRTFLGKK